MEDVGISFDEVAAGARVMRRIRTPMIEGFERGDKFKTVQFGDGA